MRSHNDCQENAAADKVVSSGKAVLQRNFKVGMLT